MAGAVANRWFAQRTGLAMGLLTSANAAGQLIFLPLLALMAVAVAVLLWWRGARVIVAVAPAIALGFAGVGAGVAKQIVGRPRPPTGLRLVSETEPSFPSGHTTDSTAFYLDVADLFFDKGLNELGVRILSNLAEMDLENRHILRVLAR